MKAPPPAKADASGVYVKVPLRADTVAKAASFMGAVDDVRQAVKDVEATADALLDAVLRAADLMRVDTRRARRVVAQIRKGRKKR